MHVRPHLKWGRSVAEYRLDAGSHERVGDALRLLRGNRHDADVDRVGPQVALESSDVPHDDAVDARADRLCCRIVGVGDLEAFGSEAIVGCDRPPKPPHTY